MGFIINIHRGLNATKALRRFTHAVGDKQDQTFQLSFNASLKIDFQGSRITSGGALVLGRELDERLGFGDLIAQHLTDSRWWKTTQLPLTDLLRQSVYPQSRAMRT